MTNLNKTLIGIGVTAIVGGAAFIATRVVAQKKNQEEADKVAANPNLYEETPEQIQEAVDTANGIMQKHIDIATKVVVGGVAVVGYAVTTTLLPKILIKGPKDFNNLPIEKQREMIKPACERDDVIFSAGESITYVDKEE